MLTKMLPEQVAKFWDVIKYAVEESVPPTAGQRPEMLNRVLAAALSGKCEVWASYTRNGEGVKFEGIAITQILYDDVSDTKNLLIYCVYGYTGIDQQSWITGIEALTKYAEAKRCAQIIAYTELPYVVSVAKRLGADARYTFISFNTNEMVQKLNELGGKSENSN